MGYSHPAFGMFGGQLPGFSPSQEEQDTGSDGSFDPSKPRIPKRKDPLLDLLNQPSLSLDAFKQHIAERPTREQFAPSKWDRIAGGLVGAFQGIPAGSAITQRKFNRAAQDYGERGQGLEDQARIEEADLNRRVKAANYSAQIGDREDRRAAEQARLNEERRRIDETIRHNKAEEGKPDPYEVRDPKDPTRNIVVDKKTGKPIEGMNAKLGAAEIGHVNDAKNIVISAKRIRNNLPKAEHAVGPIAGNWQQIKQKLGTSKDASAIRVSRELEALEMIHSKVLVGRGSYMVAKLIEGKFKNIDQFKEALNETLNVLEDQAQSSIQARTGEKWNPPVDEGGDFKEYKTKSGKTYRVRQP